MLIRMIKATDHPSHEDSDWEFSIEFFPPKSEGAAADFRETAWAAEDFRMDFLSITYGAGGKSRDLTWEFAEWLKDNASCPVMPHFTCIGQNRDSVREQVSAYYENGFRKILALRGDLPPDETHDSALSQDFRYAVDLVRFIRENFPEMEIGVAGYPEKHPEAADHDRDLKNLKMKVDAGASSILTQLFFNNEDFFRFRDRCRDAGITTPIHAGLLPPVNLKQLERFCGFCGSRIPRELTAALESAGGSAADERNIGLDWTTRQMEELLEDGVEGIHLYALNRPSTMEGLKERLAHIPGALQNASITSQKV